jgi:hypothetical protein
MAHFCSTSISSSVVAGVESRLTADFAFASSLCLHDAVFTASCQYIQAEPIPSPEKSGGLNGSMQYLKKVFMQESKRLISFAGVNSNKAKPCLGSD